MPFPDPLGEEPVPGERGCMAAAILLIAAQLAAAILNLLAG